MGVEGWEVVCSGDAPLPASEDDGTGWDVICVAIEGLLCENAHTHIHTTKP